MKPRHELKDMALEAVRHLGGSAHYMDVYKYIWSHYHAKLTTSGDEWFYRWQYELSHAASLLSSGPSRVLKNQKDDGCPSGIWALK